MRKIVILTLLVAIALIGTGCENLREYEGFAEVENIENEIEDNGMDEEHVREVRFREVDLSKPYWAGEMWMDMGVGVRGEVDLSQFAGQAIESREQAEIIAYEILEQQQADGFFRDFILGSILHDPLQNIWIFSYGQYPPIPGSNFLAAVDGDASELLRMWVD
jgi:hypothetical protein